MSPLMSDAALDFDLPAGSEATAPAERRGLSRDRVRMLVARGTATAHHVFADLPNVLAAGDLLVVNTSATLPAALDAARGDGRIQPVHVATDLDDGRWVVEVRRADNTGPDTAVRPGARLSLPGGVRLAIAAAYPDPNAATSRLWTAWPEPAVDSATHVLRHGRPIRYGYIAEPWPLADYQTVFATHPGSAEMPSAGRPFTDRLVVRLLAAGVAIAPVTLHCGVSSPEVHEPPAPERFAVTAATARLVDVTRASGGRVVAVGTTVVRALESAVDATTTRAAATAAVDYCREASGSLAEDCNFPATVGPQPTSAAATAAPRAATAVAAPAAIRPVAGWTDLVLGPDHPARVVDGLITGLHGPGASHLQLLEAVAGRDSVRAAYSAALDQGYLWHEFGDTTLFLP
jgi:S-adenosylmethionine:tRNA ribosyltransferase-isomerase